MVSNVHLGRHSSSKSDLRTSIYSRFGSGRISLQPETALAASHAFKGYIDQALKMTSAEKVFRNDLRQGSVFKRLNDRCQSFNLSQ
mmetsp:Transcript_35681/g.54602  ORF Transcript_35681/g.54602 Transcript_35681/m.54602 type:complete len:86 (-) Transcript_35681:280-537(-)